MAIATLPAGHVPTAAELKSITDALLVVQNIGTFTENTVSPTVNTTTTAYADFTGAAVSFTKLQATSLIIVHVDISMYMQTAQPRTVTLAASIGGTDYQVSQYTFTELLSHRAWSGSLVQAGIAAGSYTIQLRSKVSSTGCIGTADFNDAVSLVVQEIPQ